MSLEELRNDLKRNLDEARACASWEQVRSHLINTVWPFIEANLDVVDEIDEALAEHLEHEEDYLQPETAALFAAVVQLGLTMGVELKKRAAGDKELLTLVAQHEQICSQAVEVLGAITMVPNEEEGDEDEDEDEADQEGTPNA